MIVFWNKPILLFTIYSVTSKPLGHPVPQHLQAGEPHLPTLVPLQGVLVTGMARAGVTTTGVGAVQTLGVLEEGREGIEGAGLLSKDRGEERF